MKKLLKAIAVAIAAITALTCGAACGGSNSSKDTLKITVSELGFGIKWLEEIAGEFESIYNAKVEITPTVRTGDLVNQLKAGYQLDDLLFFGGVDVWDQIREGKFLNIDDVWNSAPDEETVAIKDKVVKEYANAYLSNDGHYYSMPWTVEAGVMNYNATTLDALLGKGKWTLPRTTFELKTMAEDIKAKGGYAFTWTKDVSYWICLENVWTAQYDGAEAFEKMQSGRVFDETKNEYVIDIQGKMLDKKGRLRAYQEEYPFLSKNGGLSHKYCTSMDFATSQNAFIGIPYANDNKSVAFTPSGNWVYEESLESIEYKVQDIGCMNAPVTSALSELLSYYDSNKEYPELSDEEKAKYDEVLVAIIDYADGKTTEKPTAVNGYAVTDADIERVKEALGVAYLKDQAQAFIPYNSGNPELAKKFLKFFASDYAGSLYSSVTHGFSPYYVKVDEANSSFLTAYDKQTAEIIAKCDNKVLYYSKNGFLLSKPAVEEAFMTTINSLAAVKDTFWKEKYYDYNKSTWSTRLANAGLKAS